MDWNAHTLRHAFASALVSAAKRQDDEVERLGRLLNGDTNLSPAAVEHMRALGEAHRYASAELRRLADLNPAILLADIETLIAQEGRDASRS